VTVVADSTGGAVSVATRMDGIDYYGFETVNIDTGSRSEVFNVQGTTQGSNGFAAAAGVAVTNVALHDGDDRVFLSSNANLDQNSWSNVDFLTGNLDDFRGTLNIDLGAGRHKLFMSDEASSHDDNWTITGNADGSSISVARAGRTAINYTFDAAHGANLYDGVAYWTGSGNDTVTISQIARLAGQRTTTSLNTGVGNDTVTATLADGGDALFVANLSGGSATGDPKTHSAGGASDTDSFDGSLSTLPLVVFGGFANDTIHGGSNRDVILGDLGRVQYVDPVTGTLLAQFGYGGRGDLISSRILDPMWVYTFVPDLTVGGNDTIYGLAGQDILIGGAANDAIDGGTNDDLIFGDAVQLFRRDVQLGSSAPGTITNPRFEALMGTQIYSTDNATLGAPLNNLLAVGNYRDGDGSSVPDWAEYAIHNLYQSYAIQAANDNSWGSDYIAGGAGDDMIFGQLGNDVIQGDGSIDLPGGSAMTCTSGAVGAGNTPFATLVGACRDNPDALLQIHPSVDNLAGDGSDYIEGGGGSDVIFGNQGQDDIIGGSSDLFSLDGACTAANEANNANGACKRPDAPNMIFGGSGRTDIAQNDLGPTGLNSESHDADTIVANNGRIVRIVGVNNAPTLTGFQTFGYDTAAFEGAGSPTYEHIVPRAVTLLDYTPGGTDLSPATCLTGPVCSGNIGAGAVDANQQARGTEIHGGNGDDTIYGGAGNDVLFGDGQNDVITGGYGNDWISGGNGDDGILGDDGRIFVSRVGIAEPLFAIGVDPAQSLISTPGTMQEAVINTLNAVRFTAVLTPDNLDPTLNAVPNTNMPRPLYANDIIYGGLGNDALHGGAGDDAMSGGEAPAASYTDNYNQAGTQLNTAPIPSDFKHPYNPGNVLGYSPTLTYQAQYNPNDPFREITLTATGGLDPTAAGGVNWLLNFSSSDGPTDAIWCLGTAYACVPTDGNDALFGDLGNDWLVGGTGRDTMYGGWGNDYLNADDVLNTGNSVTNVGTDTNPSYEDVALGGAGRDVLQADTGGDRLIDWSGEFDSYLTPFAPFGMATVSRTVQPQLPEYLYALSLSDGADPFLAAHYGSDGTRNGEPFGELGIVLQHDVAWGDQKGKPRDPQAGNSPGVQRDVLRTAGNKPINSPDTDPPVVGPSQASTAPAAPALDMAAFVSNGDQTLAPIVITGAIGATVHYTFSSGSKSISGSGVIGNDGKLSVLVDVSGLPDGTVTASATLTLNGRTSAVGSTTVVKNTVIPGSVGLAQPGYVGLAGIRTSAFVLNGTPGFYVNWELDGPGYPLSGDGFFDAMGRLVVVLDFTGNTDGIYYLSAWQQDPVVGSISPVGMSTPTETLDTAPPTGSFTPSATLTNNPAITLSLSYADNTGGTGLYQMRISADGGTTWSAWQAYASTYNLTLPSPDATYNVVVQVADKAGNYVLTTRQVILDRTGATIVASLPGRAWIVNAGSGEIPFCWLSPTKLRSGSSVSCRPPGEGTADGRSSTRSSATISS